MTDTALLPCPHCGGKEHEIGAGDAGHSITCHSFSCRSSTGRWHTREQAIAAWNRRASPSQVAPANPAQVTDEIVRLAGDILMSHGLNAPEQVIYRAAREVLETAAIGAGGQAVATEAVISAMVSTYNRVTGYALPQASIKEQRDAMLAIYAVINKLEAGR